MNERTAELLAAVLADPDADAPRLVYADHLMSIGDPRGELIAIDCAIAAVTTPERRWRRSELVAAHIETWGKPLGPDIQWYTLERGFFAHWHTTAAYLIEHAARVFAIEPIVEVRLLRPPPVAPVARAIRALVPRVRSLQLAGHVFDDDVLAALGERELRAIDLSGGAIDATALATLARASWGRLEALKLSTTGGLATALQHAPALRAVELRDTRVEPAVLTALGELRELAVAELHVTELGDKAVKALVDGAFPALERLMVGKVSARVSARLRERFGKRVLT